MSKKPKNTRKKSESFFTKFRKLPRIKKGLAFAAMFGLAGGAAYVISHAAGTLPTASNALVLGYVSEGPQTIKKVNGVLSYASQPINVQLMGNGQIYCSDGTTVTLGNKTLKPQQVNKLYNDVQATGVKSLPDDIKPTGAPAAVAGGFSGITIGSTGTGKRVYVYAGATMPASFKNATNKLTSACNNANIKVKREEVPIPLPVKFAAASQNALDKLVNAIAPSVSAAPLEGFYGSVENDQAYRINSERNSAGINTLYNSNCLHTVAENYARYMAINRSFSHNPNLANDINNTCGSQWSAIGENVGKGGDSAGQFAAYMASSCHRANILSITYTQNPNCVLTGGVGSRPWNLYSVGAYIGSDGNLYTVQLFAYCPGCSGSWTTQAVIPGDPQPAPAPTPPPPSPAPAPAPAPSPTPVSYKDTLYPNEELTPGQKLVSAQGRYCAVLQGDGNFVVYRYADCSGDYKWASSTSGANSVHMGGDGNLTIYSGGTPLWSAPAGGGPRRDPPPLSYPEANSSLVMQCDGNLVVYGPTGTPTWASRTSDGSGC